MKKKVSIILMLVLISAAGWMSCQKIDQPLVIVSQTDFPELPDDTTGGDTLKNFITTYIDYKQVLLEDFTGHRCVNCPEAAKIAHDLAEELDHKLIIYAVHAGNFAEPVPNSVFTTDFRTDVGNSLYTDFVIFANPLAMINRAEFNGMRQVFKENWATSVNSELQKPNDVNLRMSNTYYPSLNVVSIDIESEFLVQPEGEYKLVVYIVEDEIIAPQLNNDPNIGGDTLVDYVHHNILRDAVNATYGDLLGNNGTVSTGEIYSNQYTFPINEDWVTENCKIIAYIGKTDGTFNLIDIIQVAELKIKVD